MKDIWWIERDLIDTFYSFLNPVLDLVPQYELFSEWYVKLTQTKSGNAKVDLAIVEPIVCKKEAFLRIPMEFKWTVLSGLSKGRIKQDAENLTKMCENGCLDSDRGDIVCRGVRLSTLFYSFFMMRRMFKKLSNSFNKYEPIILLWKYAGLVQMHKMYFRKGRRISLMELSYTRYLPRSFT